VLRITSSCYREDVHIPDGFLSPPVWAALNAVSIPVVGVVARRSDSSADERNLPLLGVLGAFVFAAQMINFPIAAGTSAHLLGGALLACTVGPAAAIVVMTAVLVIQAFVFQDGGILALGANVFNLAIVGSLAGYLPYHLLGNTRFRSAGIFLGGAVSVFASGCLALVELAVSGVQIGGALLAMSAGMFAVSAAIEGAVTMVVVKSLGRMNPAWVRTPARSGNVAIVALAVCSLALALTAFLIASGHPDSLEAIAGTVGLAGREVVLLPAPMADYQVAGVRAEWIAKAAAGIAGIVLVYVLAITMGRLLARRSP
jgi:cobalt/nickel transport system permease protein